MIHTDNPDTILSKPGAFSVNNKNNIPPKNSIHINSEDKIGIVKNHVIDSKNESMHFLGVYNIKIRKIEENYLMNFSFRQHNILNKCYKIAYNSEFLNVIDGRQSLTKFLLLCLKKSNPEKLKQALNENFNIYPVFENEIINYGKKIQENLKTIKDNSLSFQELENFEKRILSQKDNSISMIETLSLCFLDVDPTEKNTLKKSKIDFNQETLEIAVTKRLKVNNEEIDFHFHIGVNNEEFKILKFYKNLPETNKYWKNAYLCKGNSFNKHAKEKKDSFVKYLDNPFIHEIRIEKKINDKDFIFMGEHILLGDLILDKFKENHIHPNYYEALKENRLLMNKEKTEFFYYLFFKKEETLKFINDNNIFLKLINKEWLELIRLNIETHENVSEIVDNAYSLVEHINDNLKKIDSKWLYYLPFNYKDWPKYIQEGTGNV